MKIAEKYGELYDNEWTNAMDYLDDAMGKLFPAVDHPPFDEIETTVPSGYAEALRARS
jgi:hypothetical protein